MSVTLDSVVVAVPGQISSEIGADEAVILGLDSGMYFGTNGVGTLVWRLVGSPVSVSEIVDSIVAEYEVDPTQCVEDLVPFIDQLIAAGLVQVLTST